jgi:hypothetical protein
LLVGQAAHLNGFSEAARLEGGFSVHHHTSGGGLPRYTIWQ